MKDSEFIAEAIPIILVSMRFCRCCLIYKFFRDEENLLSIHSKRADQESNLIDDEITEINDLATKYHKSLLEDKKNFARKSLL